MKNHSIVLKDSINEKDYEEISKLRDICISKENISLKLELDFKLQIEQKHKNSINEINEFLYYIDDILVGYLGVCCFNGKSAEVTGLVHPDYRGRGIFKKLYLVAKGEMGRRKCEEILLLSDRNSISGKEFIIAVGAKYSFSEYQMELQDKYQGKYIGNEIKLRKAQNSDFKEIAKQNNIYFGGVIQEEYIPLPENEEKNNSITYLAELDEKIIGKIRIDINNDVAGIYGFGIIPEYRGKGYGRSTLANALNMLKSKNLKRIYLEVESENSKALGLYKSCGFIENSIMDYYSAE
jgi:ribosomal protein S18 acetylase RimI-like enzyme